MLEVGALEPKSELFDVVLVPWEFAYELEEEGSEWRGRTFVLVARLGEVRCGAGAG